MKTYTLELNIIELSKLITACNMALVSEEKLLKLCPDGPCKEIAENSIEKLETIKAKIKDTLLR